jgi:uncharacterized membrane protein YcaP (DUF421 family)
MRIGEYFFDGWAPLGRIALLATLVYVVLVAILRVMGPRALAKMSAYDLIVTVALGSLVASIPLQKTVTLADGFVAIGVYLALQRITSMVLTRSRKTAHFVEGRATLIMWDGQLLHDRMLRVAVTVPEVHAAVRSAGIVSLAEVLAVVLERDGSWSVIGQQDPRDLSALSELDLPWELPPNRARVTGTRKAGKQAFE